MAELTTLARPYAKAAFEYAAAANALHPWSDMLGLLGAITREPQVEQLLTNPGLSAVARADKLIELCGERLDNPGRNLVRLLAENRRLGLLPFIQAQFDLLKANREKAVDVEIQAANEVDPAQLDKLAEALKTRLARSVNLSVSIDKTLLGGAVIRAGDTIIDGSIRGRLNKLAEALHS